MKEVWKWVPDFENVYKVSNTGKVLSFKKSKKGIEIGTVYKDQIYYHVQLRRRNYTLFTYIHILVAQLFIPNPQNKPCVNHKDFNPKNNYSSNLEWVTEKENTEYSRKHLYFNKERTGQRHPRSIFTNDQVSEMRKLRESGMKYSKIATIYGAKQNTVLQIFRKNYYPNTDKKHIIT